MDEGFILSNKFRKIIFEDFASGESDLNRIAKKNHIIRSVVMKVTDDFLKGNIIEKKGNGYVLTKEGEKLAENMG